MTRTAALLSDGTEPHDRALTDRADEYDRDEIKFDVLHSGEPVRLDHRDQLVGPGEVDLTSEEQANATSHRTASRPTAAPRS
jgi:hypothetical protein